MGEIADMMLDGTLCEMCGVALIHGPDEKPAGYPDYCSEQCARDRCADWWLEAHDFKVETP